MKRIKKLEYPWIFKGSFYVCAYTIKHSNGKKYIVYAHNFNDMNTFITKLELFEGGLATYQRDHFDHFTTEHITSYIPNKKGEPKKKPFWYRGRVYEMAGASDG